MLDKTYDKFSEAMLEDFFTVILHNTVVWDRVATPVYERVGRILDPMIWTLVTEDYKEI
jgi:hypothetical protein